VVGYGCVGETLPNAAVSAVFDRIELGVLTGNLVITSCFAPTFERVDPSGIAQTVTREQAKGARGFRFKGVGILRYKIQNRQIVIQRSDRAVVTAMIYADTLRSVSGIRRQVRTAGRCKGSTENGS